MHTRGKPHATKLTYRDLRRMPEDRWRHELIAGRHYVLKTPPLRHQRILGRLLSDLSSCVTESSHGEVFLGPLDVVLARHDVFNPDLFFVSRERARIVTERCIRGAPDLVVEILSYGTRSRDQGIKRARYERFGVDEYWIVDPDRDTTSVYRRQGGRFTPPLHRSAADRDLLTTSRLPGLEVALAKLFVR
jgi:Uma2 family endonuclease